MAIFAVIYGSDPGIGYRVWIRGLRPTMDIEFHYYMTYLVAARAGFRPAEAAIIAQAAQEVDDNYIPISVSKGTPNMRASFRRQWTSCTPGITSASSSRIDASLLQ